MNVSQVWIVVNAFTMFRKMQNIAGNGWLSRDHPTFLVLQVALRSRAEPTAERSFYEEVGVL